MRTQCQTQMLHGSEHHGIEYRGAESSASESSSSESRRGSGAAARRLMLLLAVSVGPALVAVPSWAQSAPPAAAPASAAASAPTSKTTPRQQTAAQKLAGSDIPGDMRPENPVVPQISVPLGRTPPAPLMSKAEADRKNRAQANGGIDDSVARCRAMTTAAERSECRRQQQTTQPSKR